MIMCLSRYTPVSSGSAQAPEQGALRTQMLECRVMILVRPTRKMSTMTGRWPRFTALSIRYRYLPTTDTDTFCAQTGCYWALQQRRPAAVKLRACVL
jgi:hypothetical protein